MRSILEKAIVHLLNEENEQAEALFHKFMVEKARQIHESLRSGDDALMESFDESNADEMFSEDDLSGLEDDAAAGDEVEGDEFGSEDEAAGDVADDTFGADEVEGDTFGGDVEGDDAMMGADEAGMDDEGATLDSIEAKLEDLQAQFDALVGGDEADMGGDEFADEADLDADMGGDEFASDEDTMGGDVDGEPTDGESTDMAMGMEDDMQDGEVSEEFKPFKKKGEKDEDCDDDKSCNDDEEFDDITESIVSELEKVMVSMTDGKEIGAGKSFSQNSKSPALQKKPNPMTDGKPVRIKSDEHKGFERETSPSVKDMKKRKNTKSKADQGQSSVSKEGDKSALINKTPGAEAQTHSPLAKR